MARADAVNTSFLKQKILFFVQKMAGQAFVPNRKVVSVPGSGIHWPGSHELSHN